jgi:hypothetical protein
LDDPFFCPEVLISEDGFYITVAFGSVLEPWDQRGEAEKQDSIGLRGGAVASWRWGSVAHCWVEEGGGCEMWLETGFL